MAVPGPTREAGQRGKISLLVTMHGLTEFQIYAFLVTLPVDGRILTTVGQQAVTYQEIFPVGQPLKSLYALYAIQEYLDTQSSLSRSNNDAVFYERALLRALTLIVCAICDRDVVDKGSGAELKILLALRLVELLLAILRGM